MKLLDLFCGAGGAAMGYSRAGFTEIVGVDNRPQKHYPFTFVQADALEYVAEHGREYDAIHASPPCQGYSVGTGFGHKAQVPRLIAPVREMLIAAERPYVIENVSGARRHLRGPVLLCGAMFGLGVVRHRFFETNLLILQPVHQCSGPEVDRDLVSVTGHGPPPRWYAKHPGSHFSVQIWKDAMAIDWMNRNELREAIPPAYTEFIGKQLVQYMEG